LKLHDQDAYFNKEILLKYSFEFSEEVYLAVDQNDYAKKMYYYLFNFSYFFFFWGGFVLFFVREELVKIKVSLIAAYNNEYDEAM
jgi:hypothetical protein